jgi:formylmethanofuran dehydrogenase subunit A
VRDVRADIKKWFESFYTIQFTNYPVDEHQLAHGAKAVAGVG